MPLFHTLLTIFVMIFHLPAYAASPEAENLTPQLNFEYQSKRAAEHLYNGNYKTLNELIPAEHLNKRNEWTGENYLTALVHHWVSLKEINANEILPNLQAWAELDLSNPVPLTMSGIAKTFYGWESRGLRRGRKIPQEKQDLMFAYFDSGFSDLSKAIKLSPKNHPAWASILDMSRGVFDVNDRTKLIEKAKADNPNAYWVLFEFLKSELPRYGGLERSALDYARKIARDAPPDSTLPLLVAEIHLEIALYKAQIAGYDARGNIDWTIMSDYLKKPATWHEITKNIDKVIRYNPKLSRAYLLYAELADDVGEKKLAASYYKKAISIDHYYGKTRDFRQHALKYLGTFYNNKKDFRNALIYYLNFLQYFPEDTYVLRKTALAYFFQSNYKEQLRYMIQAYNIEPKNSYILSELCNALTHNNQLQKALEVCNAAIKIKPNLANAYRNRANVFHGLNKPELANKDDITYRTLKKGAGAP